MAQVHVRIWLGTEVVASEFEVRSAPKSRPQGSNVRFRPADDRFGAASGHPSAAVDVSC